MRGQVFEILGFVILGVSIIMMIVMIRVNSAGPYAYSLRYLFDRQNEEALKASILSVMYTTEEKTGRRMDELLGIAANARSDTIDFGPVVGKIDVTKEVEWRYDSIFGKGKWNLKVPFPNMVIPVQLIIVLDVSSSLCDDIDAIRKNLPTIIRNLVEEWKQGILIKSTIVMLPNGQECCGGLKLSLGCKSNLFAESDNIHCLDANTLTCQNRPINEEDWARGLACATENGPFEGWNETSIRIGIVLSDEVTTGDEYLEANNPQQVESSLNAGIEMAKKNGVTVFPIKTETGKEVCPSCDKATCEPNICMMWWNNEWKWVETRFFTALQCKYDSALSEKMETMASKTGGKMYSIRDSDEITKTLKEIVKTMLEKMKLSIDMGASIPKNKNTRVVTMPLPVSRIGEYTNAYLTYWS